ncbi:MFS transporter [Nocardia colli]|uniref:MFS transporter n=1 Tax=Nocardia colli TaxID=2545717 RepID=A0A5N0EJ29_9NOCA|nr:MFS transporter [Nocardia colli]KAA8888966.1 MFS transporter [Nocardia colli]
MVGLERSSRWLILATVCLAVLVIGIDNTIVNIALPELGIQLGATTTALQWVVDAYVLAFAGLLLVGGYLADRYGHRRVMVIGLAGFAASSAAASTCTSIGPLIGWQAAMGVAAALIYPTTLAVIAAVFTDRGEKALAIGIWSGVSGVSIALGPLTGGLLLAHFWWGSVFLVTVPVAAVAIVASMMVVPEWRTPRPGRFDVIGAVTAAGGLTLFVWAIIEAPGHGWTSRTTVGAFVAAAALLSVFYGWERRNPTPLLDVSLFGNPRFAVASGAIATAFFGLVGLVFMIMFFFQIVRGYGTVRTGVATLPFAICVAVFSPVALVLTRRIGNKIVVASGLACMCGGFLIATVISVDAPYFGPVVLAMSIVAIGLALTTGPATDALISTVPPDKAGVGSAVNDTTREVGVALGVAVMGSVLSSIFRGRLAEQWRALGISPQLIEHGQDSVINALGIATRLPDPLAAQAIRTTELAFTDGMHAGACTAAAITALGAVSAAIWLPHRDAPTPGAVARAKVGGERDAEPD